MKTLIIIAHPESRDSNTQQFLISSVEALDKVDIHYLDENTVNKSEDQKLVLSYERIIFQFPMYWYSAPYQLKKWIDEIFDDSFIKNLKGKELGLVVTMGLSKEDFSAGRSEKFTLSEIFRPFEALANKCQMTYLPIFPVDLFSYLKEEDQKKLLVDYQIYVSNENNHSFKSKETWFLNRLKELSGKNKLNKEQVNHVIESLTNNRDTLDDLLILVQEMRSGDE